MAYITLHVGAKEVLAVRHISVEETEHHKLRSEWFEVGDKTAALINRASAEGRRVIAVGTTVMRTLESIMVNEDTKTSISTLDSNSRLWVCC